MDDYERMERAESYGVALVEGESDGTLLLPLALTTESRWEYVETDEAMDIFEARRERAPADCALALGGARGARRADARDGELDRRAALAFLLLFIFLLFLPFVFFSLFFFRSAIGRALVLPIAHLFQLERVCWKCWTPRQISTRASRGA